MKKYKTFGELLAFLNANRKACDDEKLSFRLDRSDNYDYDLFADVTSILTRVYPIEVVNSTVLGLKVTTTQSNNTYVVIKLYVH